ncbi:MAG TPA: PhnD/SsuA/transferrin family substrate-binding protein [Anaeromyxobacteraceae bacterium]|nr:PhnD/SsuA/transferrin family substrate-binding protein [Anaeromyxobacteraceae bacterium]
MTSPALSRRHWKLALRFTLMLSFAAVAWTANAQGKGQVPDVLRFGMSKSLFRDVNDNDAAAALSVYAKTYADQYEMAVKMFILDGADAITRAMQNDAFDMMALSTDEFLQFAGKGLEGPLIMSVVNQSVTEVYLLLVRKDGAIKGLQDLRGRSLIVSSDLRAALAPIWLDVLSQQHGFDSPQQVFGKISFASKPTQVVLPVFFGKSDACIVTRNAWDVMGELNPQVKTQLRVIAESPPVVPGLGAFRRGISPAFKEKLLRSTEASNERLSFRQIMALFKTTGVREEPVSALDSTRELVNAYEHLTIRGRRKTPNMARGSDWVSAVGRQNH